MNLPPDIEPPETGHRAMLIVIVLVLIAFLIAVFFIKKARAEEINLGIIAQIESNNNPLAYNSISHARGVYQITPICLKDYNIQNRVNLSVEALFSQSTCYTVAKWYIGVRIPQLLKNKGIVVTTDTVLIAYNAGIAWVGKKNLPKETVYYLKKYARLSKER